MSFDQLDLGLSYRTGRGDPNREFFSPVIQSSEAFIISVGYFSTGWFPEVASALATFASGGGRGRYLISLELSSEDYQVIREASANLDELAAERVSGAFDALFEMLSTSSREALGWMIRDGVLEFRFGMPTGVLSGMLHSKEGVFVDEKGHEIAFSGSFNLTARAGSNWERVDVFDQQRGEFEARRVAATIASLEAAWAGDDPNLRVFHPRHRDLDRFVVLTERSSRPYERSRSDTSPRVPDSLLDQEGRLRDYQEEAVAEWFRSNGRGILAMATGSGKTVTALSALVRLLSHAREKNSPVLPLVTVPYTHLADQWAAEARAFGFEPIVCSGADKSWHARLQIEISRLQEGLSSAVLAIAVNKTFASPRFQNLLGDIWRRCALVSDEVHTLGAPGLRAALSADVKFRLGLSATPIRHGDEEGSAALMEYFGGTAYEFPLSKAIAYGFLTPYEYHIVPVPLDEDEESEYWGLSEQIWRLAGVEALKEDSSWGKSDSALKMLLIKRARIVSNARNKMPALERLWLSLKDHSHSLVYCGAGSNDDDERIVDQAVKLLGGNLHARVRRFTSEESTAERGVILKDFAAQRLDVLVAIRCLDEGVDVPATRCAFILGSSSNPREFIQRRGRILRRAPGKYLATIFDFVVVPNFRGASDVALKKAMAGLFRSELKRVREFANLAVNYGDTLERLRTIRTNMGLND